MYIRILSYWNLSCIFTCCVVSKRRTGTWHMCVYTPITSAPQSTYSNRTFLRYTTIRICVASRYAATIYPHYVRTRWVRVPRVDREFRIRARPGDRPRYRIERNLTPGRSLFSDFVSSVVFGRPQWRSSAARSFRAGTNMTSAAVDRRDYLANEIQ